ncbi:DUF2397 domain-containing protein [Nocardia blacklockiae]|uniref:DUF2397 domain-containing protein n=1 Tax=Nocardia blacklockiae TaxID=480036 RepID=UPI002B4AD5C0|nr:DUF2397 domain-containing protein [Nocardia blacklockiae]
MVSDDEELPEFGLHDPWAAHLPGADMVPAYLVSRFAAQYRAVVDVMLEAQDTSLTGVPFDELLVRLRRHVADCAGPAVAESLLSADEFNLDGRLDRLVRWGVLTRWQEPARTGEDFLRRRDRFQLTPAAARLHLFWTQELRADEDNAADLTLAPRAIHDRLRMFSAAIDERAYPAAAAEFQQIIVLQNGMAVAARTWQRSLAHALSGGPDPEKQDLLWRTLQAYVGMWGEQVDVHTPRIAALIGDLAPALSNQVWRACARAALADDVSEEIVMAQGQRWTHTWSTLERWFTGPDAQARRLRRQLRDLVAPWARNMHILMDTGGAVTRRAELLRLARAIERAPDEDSAWRMWDTAVGIFSARHLLLAADLPADHGTSWREAPAAPVTARFREQGTRAAVGRRPQGLNTSVGRAAARKARAASVAARKEAAAALRSRSGTSLAAWDALSEPELDFLLELFGVARRKDASGARSAVTEDGRWQVTLTPPPDGSVAALADPRGRLITVNWHFELEPAP